MIKKILLLVIALNLLSCIHHKKSVSFEKIIFHTSVCFGNCPVYHLKVNKDKTLQLQKEVFQRERMGNIPVDSSKAGYFTGTVNDTTFNKLIKELQTIGLDSLKFDGPNCCDGSEKTIIVYYNHKRKFLRSMFPPHSAKNLISILYEVCESSPVQKTNKTFEIENETHND